MAMKDLEVANVLMRVQIALLRSCAVEVSRENGYDLEEYERPEEAILMWEPGKYVCKVLRMVQKR